MTPVPPIDRRVAPPAQLTVSPTTIVATPLRVLLGYAVSLVIISFLAARLYFEQAQHPDDFKSALAHSDEKMQAEISKLSSSIAVLAGEVKDMRTRVVGKTAAGVHADTLEDYCWRFAVAAGLDPNNCPDPYAMPPNKFRAVTRGN